MSKAAILAAGEGSRLKTVERFKPIVKIYGMPLLELTLKNLQFKNFKTICVIFNEEEKEMDLSLVPRLKQLNADYFFKSTPSSMHSLFHVSQKLNLTPGEHFFVSMVDSIVSPIDAQNFHQFCLSLNTDESAILVTSFVEDEKPLTLKISGDGFVSEFQCPISNDGNVFITSGVYYFSESVLPLLSEMITNGQTKMRTFLKVLVERNHKIKVYHVNKTLDIDRPEDILSAEEFLKERAHEF
ncbi:MAG: sugar phosphate nucleotidyltransferase [Bacteriovorax sp.]